MIAVLSTSSPLTSVAIFGADGIIVFQSQELAKANASAKVCSMLSSWPGDMSQVETWCADVGPGSFTGVRVGVTMAKSFARAFRVSAGAISAFDLIPGSGPKVIPSRRGQVFVRGEDGEVRVESEAPLGAIGYLPPGVDTPPGFEERFPVAAAFTPTRMRIESAAGLVPEYLSPPAISTPNRPYGAVRG